MGHPGRTTLYFAYGSCMDDERLREHGVHHFFQDVVGAGVLRGYRLAFTRRRGNYAYADIVHDRRHSVEGIVYRLPPEGVAYLDEREGRGVAYEHLWVEVVVGRTVLSPVLTYTVIDKYFPELPPSETYLREILRGADGILSPRYMKQLRERLKRQFHLDMSKIR